MTQINVAVPDDWLVKIRTQAEDEGCSVAMVIRRELRPRFGPKQRHVRGRKKKS